MLPTILVASLHAVAGSGGSVQVDPGGTIRIQSGGQLVVNQPSTTEMDVWAEFMAALDGAHECSLCDLVNDPCACPGIVCEGDPAADGVFKEIVLDGSPGCTLRGWLPGSLGKLTSLETFEVNSHHYMKAGCYTAMVGGVGVPILHCINTIRDGIPPEFGGLTSLRRLKFDMSLAIEGSRLPSTLAGLSQLEILSLPSDNLAVPTAKNYSDSECLARDEVCNGKGWGSHLLAKLERLPIATYQNWGALRTLNLPGHRLDVFPDLLHWPSLASLTLRDNELTGEVPDDFWSSLASRSATLTDLDLASNSLNGTLPPRSYFAQFPLLTKLDLAQNDLQRPPCPAGSSVASAPLYATGATVDFRAGKQGATKAEQMFRNGVDSSGGYRMPGDADELCWRDE